MTSLFSRLQKLNKEATTGPWRLQSQFGKASNRWIATNGRNFDTPAKEAELIVECRNSLPAVLNLIEAAQQFCDDDSVRRLSDHWAFPVDEFEALAEAVAVFVSGQEEPR